MRTILATLFILILSININAQIVPRGSVGAFWVDSLYNDIYVDTSATPDDTTAARTTSDSMHLGFDYEWCEFTVNDTGATYTDSTIIEGYYPTGLTGKGSSAIASGGGWRRINFVKDSSWTSVSDLVAADKYASYSAFVGGCWAIRFRTINAEAVENKVTWIYATLSKKK